MRPFAPLAALFAAAPAAAALFAAAVPLPAAGQGVSAPAAPAVTAPAVDPANVWLLDLSSGGRVSIALRPDVAPQMVERIKELTRRHFYDGLVFHRVIDGFMAQGGDPKGDGSGGSTLPDLPAEFNSLPHVRGAVAAARAQNEDSANSQFYIVLQPRFQLDKKYTVFGRVTSGMGVVDAINRGEPPQDPTRIVHAYIASDNPPAYAALPAPVAVPATLPTSPARADAPPPARNRAPRR